MAACRPEWISITSADASAGVSGGGIAVFINLTTTKDCWLTGPPGVMVVDANGRTISFGEVQFPGNAFRAVLRARTPSQIAGEWRNVCTPVTEPLHVQMLIENVLKSHPIPPAGGSLHVPVCFDENGAPATPSASPPSGDLSLSLQTN
jgi:hypothetical protein